jgi:transposase-like protein
VAELQESFWGDLQGRVQQAAQRFFQQLSERQRDLYMVSRRYQRSGQRQDYRNGYYWRSFVTRFGVLRLRIARSRKRGFLPEVVKKFQRRAEEVTVLIREAFLRGISTRPVGRVVATLTGETVSPQTVSRITRSLDELVRQFHQARLRDDYAYLFLDGVSLRMRRAAGRECTCWWPTGCARTAPAICWRFCAAGERVRPTGRACWKIFTAADWRAKSCC